MIEDRVVPLCEASDHLHRASIAVSDIAAQLTAPDGAELTNAVTGADFDQVFGLLGALGARCERAAASAARSSVPSAAFEFEEIRLGLQRAATILHHTLARGGVD